MNRAKTAGLLTCLDAQQTLRSFMEGSRPNPDRFAKNTGGLFDELRARSPAATIRAFGEMVDLLWAAGLCDAAVKLEELWNDLASSYSFSLFCAYDIKNFSGGAHGPPYNLVCGLHNEVLPLEDPRLLTEEGRQERDTKFLRQRTRALENEIAHCQELGRKIREKLGF